MFKTRSASGTACRHHFGEEFGSILGSILDPRGSQNHRKSLPEGIRTQLGMAIDFPGEKREKGRSCPEGGRPAQRNAQIRWDSVLEQAICE